MIIISRCLNLSKQQYQISTGNAISTAIFSIVVVVRFLGTLN